MPSIDRGAKILGHYNHPDDWVRGETLGDDRFVGKMALRIIEIDDRVTHIPDTYSDAESLREWAKEEGFSDNEFSLLKIGKTPYITIARSRWADFLRKVKG